MGFEELNVDLSTAPKFMLFLLFLSLACPQTKMLNTSQYDWVKYDYEMLEKAKKRCGELYNDSPCVKLFKKYDFQAYSVICGEKTKQ